MPSAAMRVSKKEKMTSPGATSRIVRSALSSHEDSYPAVTRMPVLALVRS